MSAQPLARRGWLSAAAAQVSAYLLEPLGETVGAEPVELEPYPVVAVVSAAARSGASSVARMLAAELAVRADGAAIVATDVARRGGPPSRAAARVCRALVGAAAVQVSGRLCLAAGPDPDVVVAAGRYLAPVVLDVPPDGSGARVAPSADRVVVVGGGESEPALLDAVALVLGGHGAQPVKVANRVVEPDRWRGRVDLWLPDARVGARATRLGIRPPAPLRAPVAELADRLGVD